jgi:hypothetical protein
MKKLLILFALFLSPIIYAQTYKLFQTENIHNQLRLNSVTGEVYQIQSDGQKFLVSEAITSGTGKSGRYNLYKTENMWTYILLDRFTGKLWQCQYSIEGSEYRGSWEINASVLSTRKAGSVNHPSPEYDKLLNIRSSGHLPCQPESARSGQGVRFFQYSTVCFCALNQLLCTLNP